MQNNNTRPTELLKRLAEDYADSRYPYFKDRAWHRARDQRLTELYHRAQGSDYSRRPAPLTLTDVLVTFYAGIVTTVFLAYVLGAL